LPEAVMRLLSPRGNLAIYESTARDGRESGAMTDVDPITDVDPMIDMAAMTDMDPDQIAQRAAADFARTAAERWQALLGADLLGVYLIGSLAHGGFSRRYSDVDVAVVTERGLSQDALDGLRAEAMALSAEWGP
jgi:predicted nucleotidyltransferase